jgi:hypothetical protein
MEKGKSGVVINANLIVSMLIAVLASYSAFVINSLQKELTKQYEVICRLSLKLEDTATELKIHLARHEDMKERK